MMMLLLIIMLLFFVLDNVIIYDDVILSLPLVPPINTHLMVTWSNVGVFKPKVLTIEFDERKPRNIEEAFF